MKVRWQSAGLIGLLALTTTLAAWRSGDPAPIPPDGAARDTLEQPAEVRRPSAAGPVALVSARAQTGAFATPTAAAVYRPGERLVRLAAGASLSDVAAAHGVTVAREPGRSGYALLRGEPERLAALVRDERVAASQPHAVTSGSGNVRTFEGQLEHLQWYIDQVDPPESYGWYGNWIATYPARTFVVAVLDTGVAYETATRDGVDYVAVPSLAASPIVAPYDFVNDDPHANDDHQHGTHIASLISASHAVSELHGISPEAGIMPVKVLEIGRAHV